MSGSSRPAHAGREAAHPLSSPYRTPVPYPYRHTTDVLQIYLYPTNTERGRRTTAAPRPQMRFGGDKYTALRRTPYRPPACGRESRTESEIHKYSRNAKCRQPLPHTATIRENTLKRPSGRTSFYFFIYVFANKKI